MIAPVHQRLPARFVPSLRFLASSAALLLFFALFNPSALADEAAARGAAPEPPLMVDLMQPPRIRTMRISPDGKYLAGVGGAGRTTVVFLTDIEKMTTRILGSEYRPTAIRNGYPVDVAWINEDLLAVNFNDRVSYAVDLSGRAGVKLGEAFIRRMPERGAGWMLVYRDIDDNELGLVNVKTGEREKYSVSLPGTLIRGAFDDKGALRAATTMKTAFFADKTTVSNWYRADAGAPWQLLEEVPVTADYFIPLYVLPEPNRLAVLSRSGRDTYAVFSYDTVARRLVDLLAGYPTDDIVAVWGVNQSAYKSVVTGGMKPQIHWFDPDWRSVQASVDAALPDAINDLQGDPNGRVLVRSRSDRVPGQWYVLDTHTWELQDFGPSRPSIDPSRMRPMEVIDYKARDGLTIHAYLTRPAGPAGKPAPMVVLIHGGPNVRDRWGWNEEVQILAAQGYVVFQPQFRGSAGFGRAYKEAGYRQWGLAMQDDITDGVKAMIAQGIADPARVCIDGASYGGYAALWGAIKTPDLYACGVSFAGISDLAEMLEGSVWDDSDAVSREFDRARIGDPATVRAELDKVSPLKHAAEVRVPLLIAHGELDTRVLSSQSKAMVKALRAHGKDVQWLPFENEGHGFYWSGNRLTYYSALLSFLQRNIGDHGAPAAAAVPASAASRAALEVPLVQPAQTPASAATQ